MGSYTSPSGGGGGSIYDDGDPVSVTRLANESGSVPDGVTWVVSFALGNTVGSSKTPAQVDIDGAEEVLDRSVTTSQATTHVINGGTNISESGGGKLYIGGWAV